MQLPKTHYTERNDTSIAYQVFGKGGTDLVLSMGLLSNCDHIWDLRKTARTLTYLTQYFRVINFDRRGTGHSDSMPLNALPTWEDWADDLLTVMNAAGSERAVIHGERDGSIMAILFAAAHPDRVLALSLGNTTARYLSAPDYPIGLDPEQAQQILDYLRDSWGTEELIHRYNPRYDEQEAQLSARMLRGAATPRQATAYFAYKFGLDLRPILPAISAPTLVLHRKQQTCRAASSPSTSPMPNSWNCRAWKPPRYSALMIPGKSFTAWWLSVQTANRRKCNTAS
jgi:pimeloyl-ACP methyl ester carboxylesterase